MPAPSRRLHKPLHGHDVVFLRVQELLGKIRDLNNIAAERGQTLAQMALAWDLKDDLVTSVIIGASSLEQLQSNLQAIKNTDFSQEELAAIDEIVKRYEEFKKDATPFFA